MRDAEVENLRLAILRHQHIGGLQIAMHDATFVRVLNGIANVGASVTRAMNGRLWLARTGDWRPVTISITSGPASFDRPDECETCAIPGCCSRPSTSASSSNRFITSRGACCDATLDGDGAPRDRWPIEMHPRSDRANNKWRCARLREHRRFRSRGFVGSGPRDRRSRFESREWVPRAPGSRGPSAGSTSAVPGILSASGGWFSVTIPGPVEPGARKLPLVLDGRRRQSRAAAVSSILRPANSEVQFALAWIGRFEPSALVNATSRSSSRVGGDPRVEVDALRPSRARR